MNSEFPRSSHRLSATVVMVFLAAWLAGCTGEVKGVFRTKVDPGKVLISASDALRAIGFSVKDQNVEEGTLSGEKYAMVRWNGPAPVHINVKIEKYESGTELRVQVIPPSGAYGKTRIPFDDYAYSLRNQIPDITMLSVEGG